MVKQHISILVNEIISFLPEQPSHIVDGTFGHGGHTLAFIQHYRDLASPGNQSGSQILFTGFDRDEQVMAHGKARIQTEIGVLPTGMTLETVRDSYATMTTNLSQKADFILLDLGINREHVTDNARGFSFQGEGPLDMRFDPSKGKTAYEVIKEANLAELQRRFMEYGDFSEKRASTIAILLSNNKTNPLLQTTTGLVQLLHTIKVGKSELAPIFQCIRIATNQEFEHVDTFIAQLDNVLTIGGRCAIISFHSIEDRIIKYHFKSLENSQKYRILTKHVIAPSRQEISHNKAARSAKLRVIEKIA